MPSARSTRLPDPDAARRVISEAVPEFGPRIAAQAAERAAALHPFLEWGRLQRSWRDAPALIYYIYRWATEMLWLGYFISPDMSALINDISKRSQDMLSNMPMHSSNDPASHYETIEEHAIYEAIETSFLHSLHELPPILATLHEGLVTMANNRSRTHLVLPAQHPPTFARLRDDALAETVADQLATLIDEGVKQYKAVGDRNWPGQARGFPPCRRIEYSLQPFLTSEVLGRYRAATKGFVAAEFLAQENPAFSDRFQGFSIPDFGRTGGKTLRPAYQEATAGIAP